MNDLTIEIVAVIFGFVLRLGIPLLFTLLLCWGLKRLDARWQREAAAERFQQLPVAKHTCWNIRDCSPEKRAKCPVYLTGFETPCWEQCRQEGMLSSACLKCIVRELLLGRQPPLPAPAQAGGD